MTDISSSKPRRSSLSSLAAILLATTALAAPAFGQELPQPIPVQAATAVQSIVISGNERIEESTVLAYLPITVGQRVTEVELGQAVSALRCAASNSPRSSVTRSTVSRKLVSSKVPNTNGLVASQRPSRMLR